MGSQLSSLWSNLFSPVITCKTYKILFLGLNGAGKTTALYNLKGETISVSPTLGFNVETIQIKNINLYTWDLGGRSKIRELHHHYYPSTDGVVLFVDSSEADYLSEVQSEAHKTLTNESLASCPVLILANKQDKPGSVSPTELVERLKLREWMPQQKWTVIGCSGNERKSLEEAMRWLVENILN